jgi:HPt (histidine-containing phosphotransfer) domain-containing protein
MKHLFDFSYLHSLSDDPAFVPQMIQTFLKIVPSQVQALKEAMEKDDAIQSGLVLHQLKPSMQAFGCNTLIPEIIELELLAKTGHSPHTQIDRYHQLIADINQCIASLKQIQEQGF